MFLIAGNLPEMTICLQGILIRNRRMFFKIMFQNVTALGVMSRADDSPVPHGSFFQIHPRCLSRIACGDFFGPREGFAYDVVERKALVAPHRDSRRMCKSRLAREGKGACDVIVAGHDSNGIPL